MSSTELITTAGYYRRRARRRCRSRRAEGGRPARACGRARARAPLAHGADAVAGAAAGAPARVPSSRYEFGSLLIPTDPYCPIYFGPYSQ